eukprot:695450-Rhodomonas_salina.3
MSIPERRLTHARNATNNNPSHTTWMAMYMMLVSTAACERKVKAPFILGFVARSMKSAIAYTTGAWIAASSFATGSEITHRHRLTTLTCSRLPTHTHALLPSPSFPSSTVIGSGAGAPAPSESFSSTSASRMLWTEKTARWQNHADSAMSSTRNATKMYHACTAEKTDERKKL